MGSLRRSRGPRERRKTPGHAAGALLLTQASPCAPLRRPPCAWAHRCSTVLLDDARSPTCDRLAPTWSTSRQHRFRPTKAHAPRQEPDSVGACATSLTARGPSRGNPRRCWEKRPCPMWPHAHTSGWRRATCQIPPARFAGRSGRRSRLTVTMVRAASMGVCFTYSSDGAGGGKRKFQRRRPSSG